MANKMLIDASHPEETRVVVLRGNRVEEFDFESASKKQLRGNIYLAKVTRVEPSLQAAFVDYGGNRHGFLAFSEIHPDYYQIPVADRQALLEEESRAQAQDEDDEQPRAASGGNGNGGQRRGRRHRRDRRDKRRYNTDESVTAPAETFGVAEEGAEGGAPIETIAASESPDAPGYSEETPRTEGHVEAAPSAHEPSTATETAPEPAAEAPSAANEEPRVEVAAEPAPVESAETVAERDEPRDDARDEEQAAEAASLSAPEAREARPEGDESDDGDNDADGDDDREEEVVEQLGGDAMEEMPVRAPRLRRQYKIQEVIKRRQVLLVQVVKEERGNKGAALTTYLSLAGRYSVLMPNTARGGGISRKITDTGDRKRLKEIAGDLDVPEGMGVILRTAGASRTKPEINRDFEYLLRMWETVRELTLKSTAPTLVYEEGSLIKRSIRDLYNKDIEEIVVAGDEGFREARDFMRLLMPSHVKSVQQWTEPQPIFAKSGVESQLDAMYSNHVTLKSGGYIVIGQTEALVAIDVNSGRSTREHNIEDTALRTNLEAADEVARQLRLRDLAGLIVVDFIDMEEHRNNRAVERRMKEALRNDRARIQVGHISHFGLLEMSRQRIRTGVLEGSTIPCPHCSGSGMMRSTASIALHVLRVLEDALIKSATYNITVRTRTEVALYMLNQKRGHLHDLEQRFGVTIAVAADDTLTGAVYHAIERGELASPPADFKRADLVRIDSIAPEAADEEPEIEAEEDSDVGEGEETARGEGESESDENGDSRRRRRRRKRRPRGDRDGGGFLGADAPQPPDSALAVMAQIHGDLPASLDEATVSDGDSDEAEAAAFEIEENGAEGEGRFSRRRRPRRSRGRRRDFEGGQEGETPESPAAETESVSEPVALAEAAPAEVHAEAPVAAAPVPAPVIEEPAPAPVAVAAPPPAPEPEQAEPKTPEPPPAYVNPLPEAPVDPARPKRSGWWQRAKSSLGG